MDFEPIASDTAKQVGNQVDYILRLNISPGDKQLRIARLVQTVGVVYFEQVYSGVAGALDSTAISGITPPDITDRTNRLAQKLVRNDSLGRPIQRTIKSYYDSELGEAQLQAFDNANSMQRNPTVQRSIVGETCSWCVGLAGTYTNPSGEVFARHADCDCAIVVSGYNTRNGLVTNFVKG